MSHNLAERIAAVHRVAESASAQGLLSYLNHLVIDARPEPRLFREVRDDWQLALASRLAPLFEHVSGIQTNYPGPYNAFVGLPKGHSKTTQIAECVNHTLAFAKRFWRGYVFAEDRDQAGLLLEAMLTEARLNPWLSKRLKFKNWDVTGQCDSLLTIEAADAASSQGIRGDLLICDELTHWSDEDVWKSVLSGARKRPGCSLIVITNAGILGTWQHKVRELARNSPRWFWYEAPGRLASWMDDEAIAEDRKLLPAAFAARLYDNQWVDPGDECGFVTRAEAQACADLGVAMGLRPNDHGEPNKLYYAGIDFGSVKDRCVAVVVHKEPGAGNLYHDTVVVDRMDVVQGSRLNPVPVGWVRTWLNRFRKRYRFDNVVVDPHQLQGVIEEFSGLVPITVWKARGGQENYDMAQVLRSLIVNKQLAWPAGTGDLITAGKTHSLVDELAELIIQTYAGGTAYRMQHLPGKFDDRCVCLSMAASACIKSHGRRPLYLGSSGGGEDSLWF